MKRKPPSILEPCIPEKRKKVLKPLRNVKVQCIAETVNETGSSSKKRSRERVAKYRRKQKLQQRAVVNRVETEVNRVETEVDRAETEVNRVETEVDRAETEVDRAATLQEKHILESIDAVVSSFSKDVQISNVINDVVVSVTKGMYEPHYRSCSCCHRVLLVERFNKIANENRSTEFCEVNIGDIVCETCQRKLHRDTIPSRSYTNSLKADTIPILLKDLNFIEKRFICKVQTFMTLLKLDKGGQYAQKGLAVHFMTEPKEICCVLPRTAVDCGIVCISGKFKGFVRPAAICGALQWLKKNNRFFQDVDIDSSALIDFGQTNEQSMSLEEFDNFVESGTVPLDYHFPDVTTQSFVSVHMPWIQKPPVNFFRYMSTQ